MDLLKRIHPNHSNQLVDNGAQLNPRLEWLHRNNQEQSAGGYQFIDQPSEIANSINCQFTSDEDKIKRRDYYSHKVH